MNYKLTRKTEVQSKVPARYLILYILFLPTIKHISCKQELVKNPMLKLNLRP